VTPLVLALHVLLVVAAAFLIGVRAFRETHPKSASEDADSSQLHRLASSVSVGLVLILLGVLVVIDFGFFRVAKVIQ
jgi:hypothetical protein